MRPNKDPLRHRLVNRLFRSEHDMSLSCFSERGTPAQIFPAVAMDEIARATALAKTPDSTGPAGDASGAQLQCECPHINNR